MCPMTEAEIQTKMAERAANADAYTAAQATKGLAGAPADHDAYLRAIGRSTPAPMQSNTSLRDELLGGAGVTGSQGVK